MAHTVVSPRGQVVLLKRVEERKKLTIGNLRGMLKYKGPPRSIEEMDAAIGVDPAVVSP